MHDLPKLYWGQSGLSYEIDPAVIECKVKIHPSIHIHTHRGFNLHGNDYSHRKLRPFYFSFTLF